jgi:transposase
MAGRRCDVLDVREMLRLVRLGESARAVAKGLGVSRNTVREYVVWFEAEKLLPRDAAALPRRPSWTSGAPMPSPSSRRRA